MNTDGTFERGDRVEYVAAPVFDAIIDTRDIGVVIDVTDGWVRASWRSGVHSVPVGNVRPAPGRPTRVVAHTGNERMWALLGEELPPIPGGGARDPYMEQGCHPDVVERVWDELGRKLPADSRAQAQGRPVLAHPITDRIIAVAHGTAYTLWLAPDDLLEAVDLGASTVMTWSGGKVTDLAGVAGPGWVWGRWYDPEPAWLRRSFDAVDTDAGSRTWSWP